MVKSNYDACVSFHINNNAFFGRFVRLDNVIGEIFSRRAYPDVAAGIIAESAALAALLSSALKYDGIFTLQTKSDGPVGMVVVDITSDGTIRASASYDNERIEKAKKLRKTEDEYEETPHFLGHGYLAFTVDQGGADKMHQGIVDIQGKTLAECAERYFRQSEQIDTVIRLYLKHPDSENPAWKAAGILLQKLPETGGKISSETDIAALWEEAVIFLNSLKEDEIFNDDLTSEQILHRLYHANGLSVEPNKEYRFGCRCSREKLQTVLSGISEQELASLTEKGKINAECNFCGKKYSFEKGELLKQ